MPRGAGYQLEDEVEDLKHTADAGGYHKVHLVGYSGGGAVALAFVATYPERVKSLALCEPAVIPSVEWLQAEAETMRAFDRVMLLPPNEQMREFIGMHLRPGVPPSPPPPGEPPPWMAKRPAGLKAMVRAFSSAKITEDQFRRFHGPVYLAIGGLSNPIEERKGAVLAGLFTDLRVEIYEGRHHFDPPQRAEPERFAQALTGLWSRVEQAE